MNILGIETSCDETAAAVVADGRDICSNVVVSQIAEHRLYGGVVPEIASRRHVEQLSAVLGIALEDAKMTLDDIDAVAVTTAPGLIGALLAGVSFAKGLSYAAKKPLIPVHHLRGHIASLYLTDRTFEPPFIALVASGGHSHIVEAKGYRDFAVLGRSVDDAAGEAFDKVARALGLGYPGGPEIAKLAETGSPERYTLPNPETDRPLDVSFSGLKTAVINIINQARMKEEELIKEDLAAAFEARAVEMLAVRLVDTAKKMRLPAAMCGGVAVNRALRERVKTLAEKSGIPTIFADPALCGDNAAMIAAAGYLEYLSGNLAALSLNAFAMRDIEIG